MPKYHGEDYYAYEILRKERFTLQFSLRPLFKPTDLGSLNDEAYRKPWEVFSRMKEPSDVNSLTDCSGSHSELNIMVEKFINIKQHSPPNDQLSIDDVAYGLCAECFIKSPEINDTPLNHYIQHSSAKNLFDDDLNVLEFTEVHEKDIRTGTAFGNETECDAQATSTTVRYNEFKEEFKDNHLLDQPVLDRLSKHSTCNVDDLLENLDAAQVNLSFKEPSLQIESDSCRLKKYDPALRTSLEKPVVSTVKYENHFCAVEDLCKFVDVAEQELDLSEWNLNVLLDRTPSNFQQSFLTHPKIITGTMDDQDHIFDQCEIVETDIQVLKMLPWNPFSITAVSENINTAMKSLNEQQLITDLSESTEVKKFWTEKFESQTVTEISVPARIYIKELPNIIEQMPNEPDLANTASKTNNRLPVLRNVMDVSCDSVGNFMKLRHKKSAAEMFQAEKSAVNVVVNDNKGSFVTEEIECKIDELNLKFVNRIFEYCRPMINVLVSKNIFRETYNFLLAEKSSIEFLLKENMKCNDRDACEILVKMIPIKHALTLAIQLDSEASLDYLKSLDIDDERFYVCLSDLSEVQSEIVISGHRTSKMLKLCELLSLQSGNSLILLSSARHIKSLVIDTLTKMSGIAVAPALSFQNYSCYMYNTDDISPDFPWQTFAAVIEYNPENNALDVVPSETNLKHFLLNTTLPPQDYTSTNAFKQFKIVAYTSLDFKVLQRLETVHNFVIFQRQTSDKYSHETIIIDEKTCIVVIQNLNDIKIVKTLSMLFIKISLGYKILNIIFDLATCHCTELFSVVFASVAHFVPDVLKVNVYYCLNVDDVCSRIVAVAVEAKENIGPQWKSTELWLKRTWLTEEESNHEKLLVKIPCINSFIAQIMLTTYTLVELMSLQLQECIDNIPTVPVDVLVQFRKSVHMLQDPVCVDTPAPFKTPTVKRTTLQQLPTDANKSVQFNSCPTILKYSPFSSSQSPSTSLYQRTSLPFNTSYDMGQAVNEAYETPTRNIMKSVEALIRTPIKPVKPQSIVKPIFNREIVPEKFVKRQVIENNKFSFSYSKRRKVLVDKDNVANDGQSTLFIGN